MNNVMNCPYVKKKDRSMFKCTYCPVSWHTEKNCFKKIKDKKNKEEIEKICGGNSLNDLSIVAINNQVLMSNSETSKILG